MSSGNILKYGLLITFLVVFVFGGEKHGYTQAAVAGIAVCSLPLIPMLLIGDYLGDELSSIIYVAVAFLFGFHAINLDKWNTSNSDKNCKEYGRYGIEVCN